MAPPFFFLSENFPRAIALTHAFHGGEGAVVFGVGIEEEDFEGPVFAGLDGLGVGGDVGIGDDLAGPIKQGEVHFHGEVSVLGNIFDRSSDVLSTVIFIGDEAVIFEKEIGIFDDASGWGVGARLGGSGFGGGQFFAQPNFDKYRMAGALAQAKGFAGGGPLQNKDE